MLSYYQLERSVEEHMQTMHVPAAALAIVNSQGILYANGFGVTSVERGGAPVSAQTLFRIGSVTKPLLSTAVMRLVEMGELEPDQPLQEYGRELCFRAFLHLLTLLRGLALPGRIKRGRAIMKRSVFSSKTSNFASTCAIAMGMTLRESVSLLMRHVFPGNVE